MRWLFSSLAEFRLGAISDVNPYKQDVTETGFILSIVRALPTSGESVFECLGREGIFLLQVRGMDKLATAPALSVSLWDGKQSRSSWTELELPASWWKARLFSLGCWCLLGASSALPAQGAHSGTQLDAGAWAFTQSASASAVEFSPPEDEVWAIGMGVCGEPLGLRERPSLGVQPAYSPASPHVGWCGRGEAVGMLPHQATGWRPSLCRAGAAGPWAATCC